MTRADTVIGAGLALAFIALVRASTSLTYQSEFSPGPGFAPLWLGIAGTALSAWVAFKGARAAPPPPFTRAGLVRIALAIAGLVVAVALAEPAGFLVTLTAYLLFVTLAVERMRPLPAVAATLGTMLLIYLVFVRFLAVPLPKGPLGI